jgi:hypothetical protein
MNGIASQCNYFEFNIYRNNGEEVNGSFNIVDTALTKQQFYNCMCKFMNKNYKYVQKHYKEIVIGDTYYHNHKHEDVYVCDLKTVNIDSWDNKMLASGHIKNKLTILGVPSTRNFNAEGWMKRLTFNITNRIVVHFTNGVHTNKFYKISIVYTHEKNVDTQFVIKSLDSVIKLVVESTSD